MTVRTVPLMREGKRVGEAVVESDEKGTRILSTTFTDPEIKRLFEEDVLRLAAVPKDKEE